MKSILFVICLAASSAAFSQNRPSSQLQENWENLSTEGYRGMVFTYDTRYSGVKGSPFLSEDWLTGKLFLISGDSVEDKPLKLDIYQNELILRQRNSENYVKKEAIEGFAFTDPQTGVNYEFIKAIHPQRGDEQYFQRLTSGRAELLVFHEARFHKANYKGAYATGNTYDEFIPGETFFARHTASAPQKLKTSKNSLIRFFPDHQDEIKGFLKENKFKLSDKEDLIKVFNYYNSIAH